MAETKSMFMPFFDSSKLPLKTVSNRFPQIKVCHNQTPSNPKVLSNLISKKPVVSIPLKEVNTGREERKFRREFEREVRE